MASTQPPEVQHRIKVRILVVLASILAFLAIFTSWIDRQALDTNQWVHTSGRLLEDKEISDAIATYSVDQLYANVDVARLIKKRLPGGPPAVLRPRRGGDSRARNARGEARLSVASASRTSGRTPTASPTPSWSRSSRTRAR